jgi:hypothetical protein
MFMPDYMESHVSALGLAKVLKDLHAVVAEMVKNTNSRELWLIKQDLEVCIEDAKIWEENNGMA